MKLRTHDHSAPRIADYSRATREAISWLGERYLLAMPIKPRHYRLPPPGYLFRTAQYPEHQLAHVAAHS